MRGDRARGCGHRGVRGGLAKLVCEPDARSFVDDLDRHYRDLHYRDRRRSHD